MLPGKSKTAEVEVAEERPACDILNMVRIEREVRGAVETEINSMLGKHLHWLRQESLDSLNAFHCEFQRDAVAISKQLEVLEEEVKRKGKKTGIGEMSLVTPAFYMSEPVPRRILVGCNCTGD